MVKRRSNRRRGAAVLGSVAVFTTLVSCSGSPGSVEKSRSAEGASAAAASKSVDDLLDLSAAADVEPKPLTPEEQYVVNAAWDRLVSDCMAEAGFTWNVKTSRNIEPAPNQYPDLDALRRSGYGQDFEAAAKAEQDAQQRFFDDPIHQVPEKDKEAYENAMMGVDAIEYADGDAQATHRAGGCASKANIEIYGSDENFLWLSSIVEIGSYHDINSALMDVPGYEPALRKWQDCMWTHEIPWMAELEGWPDWDSGYAVLQIKASLDAAPPSSAVTASVIEADATCLESSGLYEIRNAHLKQVKADIWKRAGAEETDKWRLQQYALENAKRIS